MVSITSGESSLPLPPVDMLLDSHPRGFTIGFCCPLLVEWWNGIIALSVVLPIASSLVLQPHKGWVKTAQVQGALGKFVSFYVGTWCCLWISLCIDCYAGNSKAWPSFYVAEVMFVSYRNTRSSWCTRRGLWTWPATCVASWTRSQRPPSHPCTWTDRGGTLYTATHMPGGNSTPHDILALRYRVTIVSSVCFHVPKNTRTIPYKKWIALCNTKIHTHSCLFNVN